MTWMDFVLFVYKEVRALLRRSVIRTAVNMRLVPLLACILGLSRAVNLERKPQPCKSPPLLTGAVTLATQNEEAWAYVPYVYDALTPRVRLYGVGKYQNQSFTSDVLMLFSEGVMYQIDDKASKCTKQPLQGQFLPLEVPPGSSLLGSYVIGSSSIPEGGLLVNTWYSLIPNGEVQFIVTVTDAGCVPVSFLYNSDDFGWVVLSYINNVNSVDPGALTPPPFCQDVQPEGEPVDFFTVFENIIKNAPRKSTGHKNIGAHKHDKPYRQMKL